MCAVQTTQSHFLPKWIFFKACCSATGMSLSIGLTFDLALYRSGESINNSPSPHPCSPSYHHTATTKKKADLKLS